MGRKRRRRRGRRRRRKRRGMRRRRTADQCCQLDHLLLPRDLTVFCFSPPLPTPSSFPSPRLLCDVISLAL